MVEARSSCFHTSAGLLNIVQHVASVNYNLLNLSLDSSEGDPKPISHYGTLEVFCTCNAVESASTVPVNPVAWKHDVGQGITGWDIQLHDNIALKEN